MSSPYSAPPKRLLAVPTPDVSEATTPTLETKLERLVTLPVSPYANIPLSPPKLKAEGAVLAVPTPVTSAATTPLLPTKLLKEITPEV